MEIVFWVIVAIIVLAVVYVCALSFRKRKQAFGREPSMSDVVPDTKEHGIDLQARRKTYDDVTSAICAARFCSGPLMGGVKWNLRQRSL